LYEPRFRILSGVVDGFGLVEGALFGVLFLSIRGRVARLGRLVPGGV
jgi:hypothetical protein